MQLKTALFIWLGLLIGLFIVAEICSAIGLTQWITFIYYIAAGIFLSKKVLVNLITWDGTIHNTIDNVSSAKLRFALFWIIKYPILLFKLGVMKAL